jgi:Cu+-exporting ATPase
MAEVFSLRAKLQPPTTDAPDADATDPVCGMQVETPKARHTSEYGGETYYFCSPGCKRSFEKEPEKYGPHPMVRTQGVGKRSLRSFRE